MAVLEKRGPYTVTNRETRHDRFGMRLYADEVIKPDGSEGEQFWIEFPNKAVQIYPMDEEGNIYLAEEYTYAANKYMLEAAGGSPNKNESLEDAAIREVHEELGVEVTNLRKIGVYESITSRVDNPTHAYLAKVKSVGDAHPDTGEDIRLRKMPFPDALDYVRNGVITTGVVAAALWQINDMLQPKTIREKVTTGINNVRNGLNRMTQKFRSKH